MRSRDTRKEAHQLQMSLYREMTPERKGEMAALLSDDVRRIARDGIRQRHPECSDLEVSQALLSLLYGEDIAREVLAPAPTE